MLEVSQQSTMKTFFQKEISTEENNATMINVNNTNSMTNPNSSSNPLINSTETETETSHVSENKPNSVYQLLKNATTTYIVKGKD